MQAGRNNQGLATILFKKVKTKWVNPNFPSTFLLIPTNVHAAVLELQERDKKQTKGMKHIKTTVIFYNKKKKNKQFTKKRIDNKPGTLVLGSDHAAPTGKSREKRVTQAHGQSEEVEILQDAVPRDTSASGQGLGWIRLWDCCWEFPALQRFPSSSQHNHGEMASAPKAAVLNESQAFSCVSFPSPALTDLLHEGATQVPGTQSKKPKFLSLFRAFWL